jgi:sigma-E factor negative regulatory protein RseA
MNEQLSALIDDEVSMDEATHLMSALNSSAEVGETWAQYHLIGDVMRGSSTLRSSFKHDLMQKIEQEPTVLSPNAASMQHEATPTLTDEATVVQLPKKIPAYWSVAASLSAVMVVGWMMWQTPVANQNTSMQMASIAPVQPLNTPVQTEVAEIPTEYLAAHQSSAPTASAYFIQTASYSE